MKQTIVTILAALLTISATAQMKSEVSETVELMGILSRTAGFEEFSGNFAGQYSKDAEAWFGQYREHPTVAYYKDLRARHGIGYERVTSMAVHLEADKGKVKLVGDRAELPGGWQNVDLDDFVKRLNKFYADTRFHEFFEQHKTFYNDFLKTYDANVMPHIHPEWFGRFYNGAETTERFRLIIGFTYGTTNNSASRQLPGQPREVIAVCGYYINPSTGRHQLDVSLPLHEFNHSFVNPLLDNADNAKAASKREQSDARTDYAEREQSRQNVKAMQDVGQKLFLLSQQSMESLHYNDWRIVVNESLVRAAVIAYFYEYGLNQFAVNTLNIETMGNGFPWMLDAVAAIRYYAAHREQYPTLNDFYSEIARCLGRYINDEAARAKKAS